jgi:O-antigen ligase
MNPRIVTVALATFFVAVQFYTSLESLSPTPQFGYAFLGLHGALALAIAIVLAGVACIVALASRRVAIARTVYGSVALIWIGATALSSLVGIDPGSGLQIVAMMALCGAFGCALVAWYDEPGVAHATMRAYLWACGLASIAGIAMQLARVPRALYASSYGRAAGFFVTANQFAEFAEFFALVALGIALGARERRMRVLGACASAAGFAALALTFSRECYLGAALGACFFAFAMGRRAVAGAIGILTMIGVSLILIHPLPHHDPSDSFSRLRTLDAGLRVATLFPLTGVGPMAYFRVYPAIAPVNGAPPGTFGALHPHDVYVSLAGELGIVGIAAVVWGWARIARELAASLRVRAPRERVVSLGVCAALVAGFVSGLFDTIGVVQMMFVWLPYAALAVASARARGLA